MIRYLRIVSNRKNRRSKRQRIKELIKLKNRIKELRKKQGVTQDELAKAVGVTRQTVISIERGTYCASLQLAFKFARYFGEPIESIFIFEEDQYEL